jgi:hypothetical protein
MASGWTIALDLEGTLISNAMSCFPRPGLYEFLEQCREEAERVVLFTAVASARVRPILAHLAGEGTAPGWLPRIELTDWSGPFKDLRFIAGAEPTRTLLVDDDAAYVHPEQKHHWVPVTRFAPPYPPDDRELACVWQDIAQRLAAIRATD